MSAARAATKAPAAVVPGESLREVVAVAARVATKEPLARAIRLECSSKSIAATATDFEATVVATAPGGGGRGRGALEVAMDAPLWRSVVEACSEAEEVSIEAVRGERRVRVTAPGVDLTLPAIPLDELPHIAPLSSSGWAPAPLLARAIARCAPAASRDPARYNLTGVFVDPDGTLVATDGFRMHVAEGAVPAGTGPVIVRPHPLIASAEDWQVARGDHDLVLRGCGGDVTLRLREVDGQFPDWRAAVRGFGEAQAGTRVQAGAIRRAAQAVAGAAGVDIVSLQVVGKHLRISAAGGESRGCIDVACEAGEEMPRGALALALRYLSEAVAVASQTGEVVLGWDADERLPLRVRGGDEADGFRAIVMPWFEDETAKGQD